LKNADIEWRNADLFEALICDTL